MLDLDREVLPTDPSIRTPNFLRTVSSTCLRTGRIAEDPAEENTDRCVVICCQIKLSAAPLNRFPRLPARSSLPRSSPQPPELPSELPLFKPVFRRFKCFPPPSRLSTSDRSDALSNTPEPSLEVFPATMPHSRSESKERISLILCSWTISLKK